MSRIKSAIIVIVLSAIALVLASGAVQAQSTSWQVNSQHVILYIDSSGNVYMTYQVDADIQTGSWPEVWIPATTDNMQVTGVTDSTGKSYSYYLDSGYIKVVEDTTKGPGDHVSLLINSTLPGFVYQSDTAGYDIVQFTPPWWEMTIADTQVKYVLPADVNYSEVFTGKDNYALNYSGIGNDPVTGRTIVYFNRSNLGYNQQFNTAVSFPDSYMTPGAVTSTGTVSGGGTSGLPVDFNGLMGNVCNLAFCGIWVIVPIMIIIGILGGNRKTYGSPTMSMNGMGVNQNLDPVEAAMLLRDDPRRILTMIMFGLMKKGNVKLISTEPLQLQLVARKDLNYYEALFADAIKGDTLNEDGLLACFKALALRVVDKTRPYSRKETEDFYRKKIDDAWKDVQTLDTPELKLQKYDTNMFWLMADEQFAAKTPDALRSPGWNTAAIPPFYWWYPYYFGIPPGTAGPSTGSPVPGGSQPMNQTTSSVESFAKNITSSVEKTSAGVAGSVESFLGIQKAANAPPAAAPARASSGGTSCACVACACACAHCACACACAGGGHGCT